MINVFLAGNYYGKKMFSSLVKILNYFTITKKNSDRVKTGS